MKNVLNCKWLLLMATLLAPAISLFSQTINYTELNTTTTFNGQYEKYISKSGEVYTVGDEITFGDPSRESGTFAHIKKSDNTGEKTAAGSKVSGYTNVIKRIRLAGNTKTGAYITFLVQGPNSTFNYIVSVESALAKKEILPKERE